jgi:hypothetical protein
MRGLLILTSFPVRLAFYGLLHGVALHAIVVTIKKNGPSILNENGPFEWVHFGLMVISGAVFLWNWRRNSVYPTVLFFCSMVSFIAALRELDQYSEILLFEHAYQFPAGAIGVLTVYYMWNGRQTLRQEISAFMKQPPFFFLAFGFFLAAVVAQILGQRELWHAVIETPSARLAKRVFEETIETIGYLTVFFGAIETSYKTKSWAVRVVGDSVEVEQTNVNHGQGCEI